MFTAFLVLPLAAAFAATPHVLQDGFESPCETDSDGDRLANCVEAAMQTSPFDDDTDADGLSDGDEALGTAGGLDLPGLGVDPRRRDLLLELDWVVDNAGCALHSHLPPVQALAQVQAVFAAIPLPNPDGSSGIHLIIDHGQGPPFTGGNRIATPAGGDVTLTELQQQYRPVHFAANRRGYFRYSIQAHHLGAGQAWGGVAAGDSNLVTLGCQATVAGYQRNALVHELGHNLGLMHGGGDACNRKPNYNSVMNYNHAYLGLDVDCDRFPDGVDHVGFSQGTRRPLVKAALVEGDGVCASGDPAAKPVDWDLDGSIDAQPVAVDLACPGEDIVRDWDDVGHLQLPLYELPDAAEAPPPLPGDECPLPPAPGDTK